MELQVFGHAKLWGMNPADLRWADVNVNLIFHTNIEIYYIILIYV